MSYPEDNPIAQYRQRTVASHHDKQFGDKPAIDRAAKLGEEAGEVIGAIVRHTEQRDGRDWRPEVANEIGDVMIVLLSICAKLDLSLTEISEEAIAKFLKRTWNIGEPEGEAEESQQ